MGLQSLLAGRAGATLSFLGLPLPFHCLSFDFSLPTAFQVPELSAGWGWPLLAMAAGAGLLYVAGGALAASRGVGGRHRATGGGPWHPHLLLWAEGPCSTRAGTSLCTHETFTK